MPDRDVQAVIKRLVRHEGLTLKQVAEQLKIPLEEVRRLQRVKTTDFLPATIAAELRRAVIESASRKCETLKLYEPLPLQAAFHSSLARVRLAIGSNRSGKTTVAAAEIARAVTGQDPFNKYPKENGRCYCVAKDLKELGEVMYRKLCRPGAFKIIRDAKTKAWRTYRPWDKRDLARAAEVKPSPPLLPRRFIKSISWHSKKESQPSLIVLHNGWELSFYSSKGKPPHGADIDLAWFDEEIEDHDWYPEMFARLIDRRGRLVWSATPQAGTDQLYELHEQAATQRNEAKPLVAEFHTLLMDNAFVDEDVKKDFIRGVDDEEYRVRVAGEFALTRQIIYPNFRRNTHGIPFEEIPRDWSIYAAIDPGWQLCAVLFGAVPPPTAGGHDRLVLFDELYLKDCNADMFGQAMQYKLSARQMAEAFVIDFHGSLRTETVGKSIQEQYSDALRKYKIKSNSTGFDFLYGSDDVSAGIMAVHSALRIREDGSARIQVMENTCGNLMEFEVKRYSYKRENGQLTDRPNAKRHNHLVDALRYLVMMDPKYVKPRKSKAPVTGAVAAFRAKQARKRKANGGDFIKLGPGVYQGSR